MQSIKSLIGFDKLGTYPKGYDPAQHGPYDPSRYYGKPDTAFGEVKLGEISKWISRREKGFRPFISLISRAFWRWQLQYLHVKKTTQAPCLQFIVLGSTIFYIMNYLRIRGHRSYKYH